MISNVKKIILGSFKALGYTILKNEHFQVEPQAIKNIAPWLRQQGIQAILDVGAHQGETALAYHEAMPEAKIYSFEPQADIFAQLQASVQHIPNIEVFNFALGETTGEQIFHKNSFSPSSSLLPLDNLHKEMFPFAAETTEVSVQVKRLDDIAPDLNLESPVLLKMDVQGYEKHVLDGAQNTLDKVQVVIAETNFQPLFEQQTQFDELYKRLHARGFTFCGPFGDVSIDPENGIPLFTNGIFARNE